MEIPTSVVLFVGNLYKQLTLCNTIRLEGEVVLSKNSKYKYGRQSVSSFKLCAEEILLKNSSSINVLKTKNIVPCIPHKIAFLLTSAMISRLID